MLDNQPTLPTLQMILGSSRHHVISPGGFRGRSRELAETVRFVATNSASGATPEDPHWCLRKIHQLTMYQ
jgi:hypothetical protein